MTEVGSNTEVVSGHGVRLRSGINKIEMAKQLKTSRSQLDRLLDPDNDKVTLAALSRAAKAMGRTLRLELQ
jgi:hypothetical protein